VTEFDYRDADGVRHEVIVRQAPSGDWQVLDTGPDGTRLIETLDGGIDDCPQAKAVARDYIEGGRHLPWAGTARVEAIPEQGGADAHSDRRPRSTPPQSRAGGAALPHPAR
jgi:hypothetical protein